MDSLIKVNIFSPVGIKGICFFLLSFLLFSLFFFPSVEREIQPIPGFFTLQVAAKEALAFEKQIASSSFSYFSPYNRQVKINFFNEYEEISVAQMVQRMQPGDLQLDPFLQGLVPLFYDSNFTYFYLKADRPSLFSYFRLKKLGVDKRAWKLVGFSFFPYFIALFFLFTAVLLSRIFFPRLRMWIYLYVPLALFLLLAGAFYPFWSSFLIWDGFLFYAICDLTLWRKKLRLTLPLYYTDKKRAFGVLLILVVPVLLLSPFLFSSLMNFLIVTLIIFYFFLAFLLFAFSLYQKECGPGFSGFLVEPLLRSKKQERLRLLQASFYFILLFLIPSMLFFQMAVTLSVVEKNPFQTIRYSQNPQKMIARLQAFYKDQEKNDTRLISHGLLYCLHSSYQNNLHQGVNWDQLTTSLLQNQTIEAIPSYQMIAPNEIEDEVQLIFPSEVIRQWKKWLKEGEFQFFLFQKNRLFALQKGEWFFRKSALLLYWIAFVLNMVVSFSLFFWLVPIRFQKERGRSFILLKELIHS